MINVTIQVMESNGLRQSLSTLITPYALRDSIHFDFDELVCEPQSQKFPIKVVFPSVYAHAFERLVQNPLTNELQDLDLFTNIQVICLPKTGYKNE